MIRRPLLCLVVAAAGLACGLPAHAHMVSSGVGTVYDGVLHFLLAPSDALAVLALALFAGQNGTAVGRMVVFLLPVSWLVGSVAGFSLSPIGPTLPTWPSLLILGCLVAANVRLPGLAVVALAVVLGLVHGFLNGTAMAAAQASPATLVGIVAAVFMLVSLACAATVTRTRPTEQIAVRVLGSWTGAIGLLALGWSLR